MGKVLKFEKKKDEEPDFEEVIESIVQGLRDAFDKDAILKENEEEDNGKE